MITSSHLSTKTTISSVLGRDYTEPANEDEKQLGNGGIVHDVDRMYEELDDIDEDTMEDDDQSSSHSDDESNGNSSQATFSPFCEKVTRKRELPTSLYAGKYNHFVFLFIKIKFQFFIKLVFAHARHKEENPIRSYFTDSNIYKVWSLMALPVTLPIDLTCAMTKRYEKLVN
jgi:hypothetical protein